MSEHSAHKKRPRPDTDSEAIAELEAARQARAQRDAALSVDERLERLHVLCANLAELSSARPLPHR